MNSGSKRGEVCEELGEKLFKDLQERPHLIPQCRIVEVKRAERNSEMDRTKKDIELTIIRSGKMFAMPVQLKASYCNIRKHVRACRRLGIFIPWFVVRLQLSYEELLEKAIAFIERFAPMFMPANVSQALWNTGHRDRTLVSYHARSGKHRHWCRRPQRFAMSH